jgi:hypothetical protein
MPMAQTPLTTETLMRTTLLFALALFAVPLSGQEQERPANWKVRFDRAGAPDSALSFVTMTPGWHVTTGPACILYDPQRRGSGQYTVEAEIFLFPGERLEAYGVFIGGQGLEGADQTYTYFLLRKDGKFLIKERVGQSTNDLVSWTEHEAVVRQEGKDQAKNILAVEVGSSAVSFLVNGQVVTTLPKTRVHTDGIVGLRVNHRLNLHVSRLDIITP